MDRLKAAGLWVLLTAISTVACGERAREVQGETELRGERRRNGGDPPEGQEIARDHQ